MKKLIFIMGIALWASSPFFVYGQLLDPVEYTLEEAPDTVKAGEVFEVIIEASIDNNWHLYSIQNDPDAGPYPTQFSTPSSNMAIAGKVSETDATIAFDPNFETELGWHSNSAQFTIPVRFNGREDGVQTLILEVLYQVCDDRSCLPPKTKRIEREVVLAGVVEKSFWNPVAQSESGISNITIGEWIYLVFSVGLTFSFLYLLIRKKISTKK